MAYSTWRRWVCSRSCGRRGTTACGARSSRQGSPAVLAGVAGLALNHWVALAHVMTASVLVPVWLLLLGLLILLVAVLWAVPPRPKIEPEPDAHPNAVLVASD